MAKEENPRDSFLEMLTYAIEAVMPRQASPRELELSIGSPDAEHGDISSSISFRLAKLAKMAPQKIAESIAKRMGTSRLISRVVAEGGYINGWMDEKNYSAAVISEVLLKKERYGASTIGRSEKVVIESPSVNPTKSWHVGHLRNALLGDAISNIYSFCGYEVEREDYIDDLGLQVAEALWGYKNLKSEQKGKKFDQFLGEEYVKVNSMMEDKEVAKDIERMLGEMEKGDAADARAGREMAERCVAAQYLTAANYRIYKDVLIWEGNIVKENLLSKALKMAREKGATEVPGGGKYAGCTVINLERVREFAPEFENPEEHYKVLVRSNGIATYAAKDFAFHMWKFGLIAAEFKFREFIGEQFNGKPLYTTSASGERKDFGNVKYAINIIGISQSHEQSTVRALFHLIGRDDIARNLIHLAYGRVTLKEGTLSGRSGGWMGEGKNYTADDLLEEMGKKTLAAITASEKLEEREHMEEISQKVALSAIKFEFLRIDPVKEVVFEWEKALDLSANSGPYALYMYARASRILEKALLIPGYRAPTEDDFGKVGRSHDFELVKMLGLARRTVEKACRENRPDIVAEYIIGISQSFGRFYEHMPVLNAVEEERETRLAVTSATMQVLKNMLALLGIDTVEKM